MTSERPQGRKSSRLPLARAAAWAHAWLWWTRAVTLGVRVAVFDEAGRVFMVRHSYTPGWYLPGGGVDRGESAEAAAIRETREEGGLLCRGRPVLHGIFLDRAKRDHVACYIVRDFAVLAEARRDWEIADSGFFALDALPPDTSAATRRRLDEIVGGAPTAATW